MLASISRVWRLILNVPPPPALRIDSWFRSPCTCREPPSPQLYRSILLGFAVGLIAFLVVTLLGKSWEEAHSKTGRGPGGCNLRILLCGLLYVVQQ
eukprot:scaffold45313_cov32-Tisochrysis_lutea.AAC.1